ncbi:MAG: family 10 glycosylhydrolase [Pirellulales bacterium]|nr:family 10 glycosylhydrolase [Pirellulales bacterium]
MSVDQGSLVSVRPLGIEADEPGSMWIDGATVRIDQRSPRLYDGMDVLIDGPVDTAKVRVSLSAADDQGRPTGVEVPLKDVLGEAITSDLDDQGTRLLIRRTPGDDLQVRFDRPNLVFAPDEVFSLDVIPHLPHLKPGSSQIQVQLLPARGTKSIWEQSPPLEVDDKLSPVSVRVPLRVKEGVYDLVLTMTSAMQTPGVRLPQVGRVPFLRKTMAQRKVQLVVLDSRPVAQPVGEGTLKVVEEIDPANERWWERLARPASSLGLSQLQRLELSNLQRMWQGPLGSGHSRPIRHALGRLTLLEPNGTRPDVSWEAYTFPIKQAGRPHVLEVEYPSGDVQAMGISILEPNAAGALMPIQLDSGVSVRREVVEADGDAPRMLRHQVVFWPRTRAPMVLITNRRADQPAIHGKIRVLAGWDHLPRAFPNESGRPGRLLAGYLDRPLFPQTFCASEAYDPGIQRSLDDWQTFFEGGSRLVEYLHHTGRTGLMVSVLAEGATIYPSQVLEPTPRFDKGTFFATAQDPVQKDVLEMLFRLFDREGLRLIPAMEFNTPLPALEAVLRQGGPQAEGLTWIGSDGRTWQQTNPTAGREGPYYNILDPRVQDAMLAATRELVERYASRHESFGGLAVQLSGYGFAQLPGPQWGLDDTTLARFEQETGIHVPRGSGPNRYAQRWEFLLHQAGRPWLTWRAQTLQRFYDRMQAEVTAARSGAKIYLATANLMTGPHWQRRLRPTLPRQATFHQAMLEVGFNVADYRKPEGPVLLLPDRIRAVPTLGEEALEREADEMLEMAGADDRLRGEPSLLYHLPNRQPVESFDKKAPFRSSYTMLHSQLVPSREQNRRPFVHVLAMLDSQAVFDGGQMLPLGQEDAARDLVALYRRLPAVPFSRVPGERAQPATVRHAMYQGRTYLYAANDSPVPVTVSVRVDAPTGSRVEPLVATRPVPGLDRRDDKTYWRVQLEPYDAIGATLSTADVALSEPETTVAPQVATSLEAQIRDLTSRAGALRARLAFNVLNNPAFEQPVKNQAAISGWSVVEGRVEQVRVEPTAGPGTADKPKGAQSIRLVGEGGPVWLASEPFQPPTTGRLKMCIWLRVPEGKPQPRVELTITGRYNGKEYSSVGLLGQNAPAIAAAWRPFEHLALDLPLSGLSDVRVGFRLIGPGELWIDDVQLRHLEFRPEEVQLLAWMNSQAYFKLQTHQIGDCIRFLEGHWPHFLEENVPLQDAVARRSDPAAPAKEEDSPTRPKLLDRVKDLVPKKPW